MSKQSYDGTARYFDYFAGGDMRESLDTANLNNPVPLSRVETGCFGIKNDFTHGAARFGSGQCFCEYRGSQIARRG